jgi:hypothetical protein
MEETTMTTQTTTVDTYVSQHDAVLKTMDGYLDGLREGKSALMGPAFHADASFFGHYPGGVMTGAIQQLFDWIDGNGPSPAVESRVASVRILGKIAYVHLEIEGVSGKLAGTGVSMSDIFTLMKTEEAWTIIQKAFDWHM